MRAVVFRRHGGPEVMEVAELPEPTPGPGEVQVRVSAAALNHIDLWMRRGLPSMKIELPHVPGGDISGHVSALGAGVRGVELGLRVSVNPGLSCGRCRLCLGGRDNLCPNFRMLGEHTQGGMADFVVVPAANIVPAPVDRVPISDAALAAVPITFITAWHMLVDKAALRRGESVLVLGAGSGVGVAAIQIAKLFGARVIAAASTERKLA
ncbi:MAG: alcohol dehydrogenase catalytic domain-containing protein, partial [Myxococcales bacterium]